MVAFISAKEAVDLIKDGDVVATNGFVGIGVPEEILVEVENKYAETKQPKDLTLYWAAGQGDSGDRGLNHFGLEGCVTHAIGGHWNLVPKLQKLALEDKIDAYNFPQGVISHMFRDASMGLPFTITRTGLRTFCDPRLEGGKINNVTKEEHVEVIELDGEEFLKYRAPKVDVAIIRGTYSDENGNISMEKEALNGDVFNIAAAARANGGITICQVEGIVESGSINCKEVMVPNVLVDYVVVCSDVEKYHMQTFGTVYNPAFSGQTKAVLSSATPLPLNNRKVCARRTAELFEEGNVANLGIGMPEGVSVVLNEEGQAPKVTMSVEPGTTGGIPMGGLDFGASLNPWSIVDQGYQFDFYNGGGLDVAVLGLAEVDESGNVNVSKFGGRVAGSGGFIDITQNVKKCAFIGTFTAGGLKQNVGDGKLEITQEGRAKKFRKEVEQVTFSADYARETGQEVYYITERAVFTLGEKGLKLVEIAPGIDLQKDVLDQMEFEPEVAEDLKIMDAKYFKEEKMGLVL